MHPLPDDIEDFFQKAGSAFIRGVLTELRATHGDSTTSTDNLSRVLQNLLRPAQQSRHTLLLSEVFKSYQSHKITSGHWAADTQERAAASYCLFLEIIGDKPVDDLTRDDGRAFRDALLRLPARRSLKGKYRDLSVKQLLAAEVPSQDRMKHRTVNHFVKWTVGCFEWCIQEGYLDNNPLSKLHVRESDSTPYRPFSTLQMKALFNHPLYSDPQYSPRWSTTYKFWTPLLAMYTGARLGELCQLRTKDVRRNSSGIWYLNIQDEEPDQSVKTTTSVRQTPVCRQLVDLGFIDYVKILRTAEQNMLFPDLKMGPRGWQQYPSRQFGNMLKAIGIHSGEGFCFHSFRKNVVDAVALNAPKDSLVSAIVGHKQLGMTFSRYFSAYPLAELKAVLDLIDYGIDLSHLSGAWKRFVC